MNYFFPNNVNDLISNTQFRKLFSEAPLLASTGAYYGFPVCCIEFFCNGLDHSLNLNNIEMMDDEDHPMIGTGYVPCPHCIEQSKNKEYFSSLINSHRFCPTYFPSNTEHNIDEDLHKFFAFISYKMYRNPIDELKKYPSLSYLINEILLEDPIYLYYKGHKINVTSIGIKNKQDFGYMVENNAFCASQLENLLEWHQSQESLSGCPFDSSAVWDCICKNEFEIISKNNTYQIQPITTQQTHSENIDSTENDLNQPMSNTSYHSKRNSIKNHFAMN